MKKYILPTAFISALFATLSSTAMYRAPRTLTELLGVPVGSHWSHSAFIQIPEEEEVTMVSQYGLIAEEICSHDNAQIYNETIPSIKPLESPTPLDHFLDTNKSIGEIIKNLHALSATFNRFKLEFLALLLKHYGTETKKIKL